MTDPVFLRIEKLLKDKDIPQRQFDADLGLSRSTYSNWKQKKSRSYLKHIEEIAEYFKVSPAYLMSGEDGEWPRSVLEDELLYCFRMLNPARQEAVMGVVKALLTEIPSGTTPTSPSSSPEAVF